MEFSYTTETTVYATDACVYLREDGKEKVADLMVTTYTPDTDKLTPKTFFLRDGHEYWDVKHTENFAKIKRQWVIELGKDPDVYGLGTVSWVVRGIEKMGAPVEKLTLVTFDSTEGILEEKIDPSRDIPIIEKIWGDVNDDGPGVYLI